MVERRYRGHGATRAVRPGPGSSDKKTAALDQEGWSGIQSFYLFTNSNLNFPKRVFICLLENSNFEPFGLKGVVPLSLMSFPYAKMKITLMDE